MNNHDLDVVLTFLENPPGFIAKGMAVMGDQHPRPDQLA
jgi:hypothetical protein